MTYDTGVRFTRKEDEKLFTKEDKKLFPKIEQNKSPDAEIKAKFFNPYKLEEWYCLEGQKVKGDFVFFAFKVEENGDQNDCRYVFVKLSDLESAYHGACPCVNRHWRQDTRPIRNVQIRYGYLEKETD